MLGWHNLWMASHGRELATQLRSAGNSVLKGEKSLWALAVVITVAVLREGSEYVIVSGVNAVNGYPAPGARG